LATGRAETEPGAEVTPAGAPNQSSLLLVIVVVVAALYLAREVLIPIALAILLSFVLAPLVDLLRRTRIGRTASVLLATAFAVGVILAIAGMIGTQVASLADDLPYYSSTIERKVDTLRGATVGRITTLAEDIGRHIGPPEGKPPENPASGAKSTPPVPVVVQQPSPAPLELAGRYLSPALSPVGTLGIVIVIAIFILMQQEDLRDRLIRLAGSGDLHKTTLALDDGAQRLSRYFLSQLAVNVGFGCVMSVGLFVIGIPQAVLWGVLSALLRFVPYIGVWLASLLPLALAAAVHSGWAMFGWTLALYVVVELAVSQGVEPHVYGRHTGLSPIAVLTSAIFWSWIWGPVGLIVSTPLTLCLVVLGRHVQRLEFFEVLLGDEPALTPEQTFYQRLLAGDEDEAREQAEAALKEQPLADYYDEVALPALRLAADDVERGILRGEQLERVRETIREVIEDLEPRAGGSTDAADERWRADGAVLCVAGRGPLDDAAALMLTQLLHMHGFGTRLASYGAASRGHIAALEVGGVMMACVLYLDIGGHPAHLRYLLERLRRRLPEAPVLVGLWSPGEPAPRGGDRVERSAGSLREAVSECRRIARMRTGAKASAEAA
jgi:predicted PurR-regulated permease PerM